jgi:flagellar hook-basal body complex protein FliE
MTTGAIEQVLAQIRSLSTQAGAGLTPPALGPSASAGAPNNVPAFAQLLKQGIDAVNANEQSADALASAWERGVPGVDLARVMIETQKASVSFQVLTQVRNRLISAYQDIMSMSI